MMFEKLKQFIGILMSLSFAAGFTACAILWYYMGT
jgi:hypothetical protein